MSQRYRTMRRRESASCFGLLLRLAVAVMLIIALYAVLVRPRVGEFVGEQIAGQLGGSDQTAGAGGAVLPGAVAALPAGELTVTEQAANQYIAANPTALGPLDDLQLRFTPGNIEADISAFGAQGQARLGLESRDGRIVVVNPQLSGPLGLLVPADDVVRAVEQHLNAELQTQNRLVSVVRVEQGQVVILVE